MPSLPENALGRRMVLLPNWIEFGEGHFIEPTAGYGFGFYAEGLAISEASKVESLASAQRVLRNLAQPERIAA